MSGSMERDRQAELNARAAGLKTIVAVDRQQATDINHSVRHATDEAREQSGALHNAK